MTTADQIPILDLGPEIEELWDELNAAIQRVLRSAHFIMGPEVKAFEEALITERTRAIIPVHPGTLEEARA